MKRIIFFSFFMIANLAIAQVGINSDGSAPDTSAMLDIKSTTSGLLIPRMSATDRDNIASPAQGLTVYVTDDNSFYYYDGTQWVNLSTQADEDWKVDGNNMYSIPSGNVGIGTSTPAVKLEINGDIRGNNSGAIRINTGNGYVDIGPKNIGWSHFYTDRAKYYFNKRVIVDEGIISSYNEDLQLATSQTTRITVSNDNGNVGIGIAPQTDAFVAAQTDQFDKIGNFTGTRTDSDDIGVYGDVSVTDWYGIGGEFTGGWMGVRGVVNPTGSNSYYGVYGSVKGGSGTNYGIYGTIDRPDDSGAAGFFLNSNTTGMGIIATGNNTTTYYIGGGAGLIGNGTSIGIAGVATDSGDNVWGGYFNAVNNTDAYAFVGGQTGGIAYKIQGPGSVSTVIRKPNGEKVTMFAPEAPEILFQDYGKGHLTNGKAHINIDPVLTKNIIVDQKHPLRVFIQLEGDCNGVFVNNKSSNGFDVIELQNGQSNVDFSWMIIANRADEYNNDGSIFSKNADARFPKAAKKPMLIKEKRNRKK